MSDRNQYIQVDFLAPYEISGVITQGGAEQQSWVTKYNIFYSSDGINYYPVTDNSQRPTVFNGNTNSFAPVTNSFSTIVARYVQIRPLDFHGSIALRFNLLGCQSPSPTPTPAVQITVTSVPTPAVLHTCTTGWSTWINSLNPASGSGDFEAMTDEDKSKFCPGGKITDINCVDADTGDDYESLAEATCTVSEGLKCLNEPDIGLTCRDYKIRYMCTCSGEFYSIESFLIRYYRKISF